MRISIVLLLFACIALAEGTASADYVLIKYRSGNVQTLQLDEPSSKIMNISYQEEKASSTESSSSRPVKSDNVGTEGESVAPTKKSIVTPQTSGKPGVRIEWAPPME